METVPYRNDSLNPKQENRIFFLFLISWFVVNALQACFLGVDGDEAYYWYLSQKLDWGYFDHPPMVALLIRMGETLGHGPFFTRLGTVVISTLSIGLVYKIIPASLRNIKWYILLCAATLILNVYSFITTPDSPLLFFALLFLFSYKSFLKKNTIANSLLMTAAVTGMFYSKYHGILLVAFVVLSNIKLLRNKYFWLVIVLTTLLFLPHIYWQYMHDWPSIRFHLNERLAKSYKINYTTDYLSGQLLIFGPFISLLFYITCYKLKIKDHFLRAHVFILFGTLFFFFISSFKNTVEPHWTLIGAPSYIVLFMWLLQHGTKKYQALFTKLAVINIVIIILARVLILVPHSPFLMIENYAPFFYGKTWAKTLYSKAGSTPVVFKNSYVMPSLYMYYNEGAKAIDYNTKSYRKTNFNLQDDCTFSGQKLWYYKGGKDPDSTFTYINTKNTTRMLIPVNQYTCVNSLKIKPLHLLPRLESGHSYNLTLELENKSPRPVILYNTLEIDYAFFIAKYEFINSTETYRIESRVIKGYEKEKVNIQLKTPDVPGTYKLLFSIRNGFFPGNFASAFYPVKVG